MTRGSPQPVRRSDSGAALILALAFLLGIGAVLVPLVSLAGSNMINTSNLQTQRGIEFSADAIMDGAIQTVRHEPPTTSCPTFPGGSTPSLTVDGTSMEVQCSEAPVSDLDPFGRNVEFDACVAQPAEIWATCQANAVIRAQVSFDDLAPGCTDFSTPACISHGNQMSVWSWVVRKANG